MGGAASVQGEKAITMEGAFLSSTEEILEKLKLVCNGACFVTY